jgi:hypothetical protein
MSVKEKIGQLQQVSYCSGSLTPQLIEQIAAGQVGSVLNVQKI